MGVVGIDRVRNEDICESLGRVAVMGVMNEKEENWKEKLKGMNNALGKQLYEGGVLGRRPRGQTRKRWDDSFKLVHAWTLRN